MRTGVTEVTASVVRPGHRWARAEPGEVVARIAPVRLRASGKVRLSRLHPRAILKEDLHQLIVPLASGPDLADRLAALLGELVPAEPGQPAGADPDAAAVAAAEALAAGSGTGRPPTI